jgi:hypothetical protein
VQWSLQQAPAGAFVGPAPTRRERDDEPRLPL